VKDFHVLMDLFERNGVKFVSVTQSLNTLDPMGLYCVLLDFAQFEHEMTANSLETNLITRCRSRDKSKGFGKF
jgi:DNA invertase Pin-like site-specific DNA recombinase